MKMICVQSAIILTGTLAELRDQLLIWTQTESAVRAMVISFFGGLQRSNLLENTQFRRWAEAAPIVKASSFNNKS